MAGETGREPTPWEQLLEQVKEIEGESNSMLGDTAALRNHLMGPVPEAADDGTEPSSDGLLDDMRIRLRNTMSPITESREIIRKLRNG